jgi:hypothetical protein
LPVVPTIVAMSPSHAEAARTTTPAADATGGTEVVEVVEVEAEVVEVEVVVGALEVVVVVVVEVVEGGLVVTGCVLVETIVVLVGDPVDCGGAVAELVVGPLVGDPGSLGTLDPTCATGALAAPTRPTKAMLTLAEIASTVRPTVVARRAVFARSSGPNRWYLSRIGVSSDVKVMCRQSSPAVVVWSRRGRA